MQILQCLELVYIKTYLNPVKVFIFRLAKMVANEDELSFIEIKFGVQSKHPGIGILTCFTPALQESHG